MLRKGLRAVFMGLIVGILVLNPLPVYGEGTVSIKDKSTKKMESVEAGDLRLFFNPLTTEIVVEHKPSGHKWYSNPELEGGKTTGKAADYVRSQIVVNYLTDKGQVVPIDNYKYSIKLKQFSYEEIAGGYRVKYVIGDNSKTIDSFPQMMSGERMRSLILDKVDEKDEKYINRLYRYDEEGDMYIARKNGKEQGTMSKIEIKRLTAIMYEKAGYGEEDLKEDNIQNGKDTAPSRPYFEMSMEYILEEDGLRVRVLGEETLWKDDYPIESINLLEYFGATTLSDEGYMLVPDGSGALIYLNNGKASERAYNQTIYGEDKTQWEKDRSPLTEKVALPVFGTCTKEGGFMAVVEKGAPMGTIHGDVSGRKDLYNKVFTNFAYKNVGTIDLMGKSSKQTVYIWSKQSYDKDIEMKYFFLSPEESSYTGMAKRYQEYLIDNHVLRASKESQKPTFYLDLIGSYTKKAFFLGIPYTSVRSMTTFKEAETILDGLKEEGFGHIVTRYIGWFNDGIHHTIPEKVKVDKVLGGKKGLTSLVKDMKEQDVEVYPDVAFTQVYRDTWGFSPRKEGARLLSGSIAKLYPYDLGNLRQSLQLDPFWLVAPKALGGIVSDFGKSYKKLGLHGLALRDLGRELHTDFHSSEGLRDVSMMYNREAMDTLASMYDLLVDAPNDYAMAYTGYAVNVPVRSSQFNIVDEDVPFYQLVLSGCIPYSGPSANRGSYGDMKDYMMRCLEAGAGLHYTWSYDSTHELKDTAFNTYNSIHYEQTIEEAASLYKTYSTIYNQMEDGRLVGHEILDNGLRKAIYGDGTIILLNYTYSDLSYKGYTVKSKDYVVIGPSGKEG